MQKGTCLWRPMGWHIAAAAYRVSFVVGLDAAENKTRLKRLCGKPDHRATTSDFMVNSNSVATIVVSQNVEG